MGKKLLLALKVTKQLYLSSSKPCLQSFELNIRFARYNITYAMPTKVSLLKNPFNFSNNFKSVYSLEKNISARHFSTYITLRSDNNDRSAEELRLEKSSLCKQHQDNMEDVNQFTYDYEFNSQQLNEVLLEISEHCNESDKEQVKYLNDIHSINEYECKKAWGDAKDYSQGTNRYLNSNSDLDMASVSTATTLDINDEKAVLDTSKSLMDCWNVHLDRFKSLVEHKKSEDTELSQQWDYFTEEITTANDKYNDAALKQTEIMDRYVSVREQCLEQEVSSSDSDQQSSPRSSIIDDYANPNTEMPDYFDPDA